MTQLCFYDVVDWSILNKSCFCGVFVGPRTDCMIKDSLFDVCWSISELLLWFLKVRALKYAACAWGNPGQGTAGRERQQGFSTIVESEP